MKLLRLEFYKCRRRHVALVCAAVLGAELCWMGAFFARQTPEEMTAGWMLLLYNLAMVDAIILPISVAVLASRNCELEHKGSSWKLSSPPRARCSCSREPARERHACSPSASRT